MRRPPTTDTASLHIAEGATTTPGFDRVYRELVRARAAYDAAIGDPERVPTLAHAAARLDAARHAMRSVATAA